MSARGAPPPCANDNTGHDPQHATRPSGPTPRRSARLAGLRYSNDDRPGITRRRAGRGFSYRHAKRRLRSATARPWPGSARSPSRRPGPTSGSAPTRTGTSRRRGATLGVESSIATTHAGDRAATTPSSIASSRSRGSCPGSVAGAIATWHAARLSRDKVLAAVVRLLELTLIRVGNDEYARLNRSFGLTTLASATSRCDGAAIRFRFRGKSGRRHEVDLRDRRLANVIRRCQELPGTGAVPVPG